MEKKEEKRKVIFEIENLYQRDGENYYGTVIVNLRPTFEETIEMAECRAHLLFPKLGEIRWRLCLVADNGKRVFVKEYPKNYQLPSSNEKEEVQD